MSMAKQSRLGGTAAIASRAADLSRRLTDVAVALIGLAVSAPALLVATLAILLDSPGPVLYWQERVGRNGRPFRLVKLRTMVADAEAHGQAMWARQQDPRVTRVGAFLRR